MRRAVLRARWLWHCLAHETVWYSPELDESRCACGRFWAWGVATGPETGRLWR